jgi:glyoxylase-like metal-dependent hydrolase (beta-lactamase superfamily II)
MQLEVVQLELGPFAENCYVVRAPASEEAVVVDPGWPGALPTIERALGSARCAAILVTHGDIDHVAGVAEAARATGAPVHMAAAESERLERIDEHLPAGIQGVSFEAHVPEVPLRGDEELDLAGIVFETVSVPGHTEAHLAFAAAGSLFSGDVLFAGSVGRTDRANGDWETLLSSIRTLVERFPPETVVYPGHGPATTLGRELETNPFLAELRPARR